MKIYGWLNFPACCRKYASHGLICRIRAHSGKRIREIPIITITGADDEETKTRAYACGATDFIIKPLDAMQLRARVKAHAKLDNTTRQLAQTTTTLEIDGATDPLTHLNSRRYFLQRVEQELARNQVISFILGVVIIFLALMLSGLPPCRSFQWRPSRRPATPPRPS